MAKFTVIGAGLSGLLAGAVLRDDCERIIEAQEDLPNNHAALLRFRTSLVGDTLNIPFKGVDVIKAVNSLGNPIADAVSYSIKTNGTATLRSLVTAQGEIERRFIAPDDFIPRLRAKVTAPIEFGKMWYGEGAGKGEGPIISTLPMPVLMRALDYCHGQKFESAIGYVTTAQLRDCDICATIYLPQKGELAYRASITNNRLIVEYAFPGKTEAMAKAEMQRIQDYPADMQTHLQKILLLFGLDASFIARPPDVKQQRYAKILPIDDMERKRFMLWATEQHNIYSLGRFATWRPGLLMDDLINDLRVIQSMASGSSYDVRRTI